MSRRNRPRRREAPRRRMEQTREKPVASSRSAVYLLIGGLAAVGAMVALDKNMESKDSRLDQASEKDEGDNLKAFEATEYRPPAEGRIWKKKVKDPDKQTVLYVPDIHAQMDEPGAVSESQRQAISVQQEIFAIIEDAIAKYGSVPVVLEEWTDFGKGAEYDFKQHVRGNYLESVVAETDFSKRRTLSQALIREGKGRAPTLLPVVYPEKLVPVASHNRKQLIESTAAASRFFSTANMIQLNANCKDIAADADMGISDVLNAPEKSGKVLDCYCTFDALFRDANENFRQNRSFDSPKEEVRRAVQFGGQFIFVITGSAHTSETLKQLDAQDVNYIVVAPRSNDMKATALEAFPSAPPECKEWEKAHQKELEATIRLHRAAYLERAQDIVADTF